MKILWLSHFMPYPPKGGAYQRSYNMLIETSRNHEVDYIGLSSASALIEFFGEKGNGLIIGNKALERYVNVVSNSIIGRSNRALNKLYNALLSLFSNKSYDELYYCTKDFIRKVHYQLETSSYDLIYVDTVSLMPALPVTDTPIILNHHNIESLMLKRRADESSFLMKLYMLREMNKMVSLERKYVKKASVNIVCSRLDEIRLNTISVCETEIIPNGVDLNYFKRSVKYKADDVSGLLFIGGLSWYPNADAMDWFATNIYDVIKDRVGDIPVNVIGRGAVDSLTKLANANHHVHVHGFVDDIIPFMEKAAIYICPIRDGGGTKLKVLDALAMGVPLVVHPIACEGIDVEDGVHVLLAETEEQFAEKVSKLLSEPELAISLSVAGRQLIEDKYSYSRIGRKLNEVYQLKEYANFLATN